MVSTILKRDCEIEELKAEIERLKKELRTTEEIGNNYFNWHNEEVHKRITSYLSMRKLKDKMKVLKKNNKKIMKELEENKKLTKIFKDLFSEQLRDACKANSKLNKLKKLIKDQEEIINE